MADPLIDDDSRPRAKRPLTGRPIAIALVVHLLLALLMVGARGNWPDPSAESPLWLELEVPPEETEPFYIVAAMPQPSSDAPGDAPASLENTPAPAAPTPRPLDDDMVRELAAEREKLKAELEAELASIAATPLPKEGDAPPPPPPPPVQSPGPVGTVRSLDLKHANSSVVAQIMARYDLRITEKVVSGGTNQNFLSSAAAGDDTYFAGRGTPPGVYEVFELSRRSVAKMSTLEEEEILRRGMKLDRTRVKSVVFGIVETTPGEYDLGILKFDAEPIP